MTASAYGVAKAATIQLTRTVATQNGHHGIRCNAVVPGMIQVDRSADARNGPENDSFFGRHQVLPFSASGDDVADVVAFLAGPDSRFVTGHALVVDGGLSIHMPTYADLIRLDD